MSRGGQTTDAETVRHAQACAECRAYQSECQVMWASLGELPVPAPPANARARFDEAVRRETRVPRHPWMRYAALAASLVFAATLGYGGGVRRNAAPSAPVATADSTSQFLLLLYDTPESNRQVGSRVDQVVAEYSAWARDLAAAGKLVSAEKLSDGPSDWFGGIVVSGSDRLGGFFLIRARDLAAARDIARQCPHLKYGGLIELRPIQPT
jgi:hypothetical protein